MNKRIHRRDFLKAGTLALGFPTIIPSTVLGQNGNVAPSERVGVGKISCGNQSRAADMYRQYEKSQIVAVCDPKTDKRKANSKKYGNCPDYNDFRDLLDNKDVDAVHISTADHWHVPIALAAARAGKDMYAEKPLGISINHDLKAREIVDKHKRVFQYGSMGRSSVYPRSGIELVLNGHIGDVKELYVWAPCSRSGGSATPVLPVPKGFDYDMWLGPAPEAPFCADRALTSGSKNGIFHIYDYAIGFVAGWGAHPMNRMQWWADNAGMKEIPVKYEAKGTLPTEGLFNVITHWDSTCTYANGIKMRFMDDVTAKKVKPHPAVTRVAARSRNGTCFVGTKGWVAVTGGSCFTSSEKLRKQRVNPGPKRLIVSKQHVQNFVDCVISRETPVDDLHSAVRSDIICHLTDIGCRLKTPLTWDPIKETIVGNTEAQKMMSRELRKPWTL